MVGDFGCSKGFGGFMVDLPPQKKAWEDDGASCIMDFLLGPKPPNLDGFHLGQAFQLRCCGLHNEARKRTSLASPAKPSTPLTLAAPELFKVYGGCAVPYALAPRIPKPKSYVGKRAGKLLNKNPEPKPQTLKPYNQVHVQEDRLKRERKSHCT